jgi:hypothetical protein
MLAFGFFRVILLLSFSLFVLYFGSYEHVTCLYLSYFLYNIVSLSVSAVASFGCSEHGRTYRGRTWSRPWA